MLLVDQTTGGGSAAQRFTATCVAGDAVGDFVRVTGSGLVAKLDIDATPTQIPDGVIISKPSATTCVVQSEGVAQVAGIVAGLRYFLGTDSRARVGPPADPLSGTRAVHFVGRGRDTGQLLISFAPPTIVRP